jgi:hypothetical protein
MAPWYICVFGVVKIFVFVVHGGQDQDLQKLMENEKQMGWGKGCQRTTDILNFTPTWGFLATLSSCFAHVCL